MQRKRLEDPGNGAAHPDIAPTRAGNAIWRSDIGPGSGVSAIALDDVGIAVGGRPRG